MPGRKYNSAEYRYGFNGKEKDDEGEFGSITNYDYGFRIYNPAIAKFLSVDPLTRGYPMLTPYQFASNTPIQAIDLDGLEATARTYLKKYASGKIEKVTDITLKVKIVNTSSLATSSSKFKSYVNGVVSGFENRYTKSFEDGARQFKAKIDYQIVEPSDVTDSDFVFSFEDRSLYDYTHKDGTVERMNPEGYAKHLGETQSNSLHLSLQTNDGKNKPLDQVILVGTHELGHALGLTHVFWIDETGQYDVKRKGFNTPISNTYIPFIQSFKTQMDRENYLLEMDVFE